MLHKRELGRLSQLVRSWQSPFSPNGTKILSLIDELIDIDYDENENANKVAKFGNYLRVALTTADNQILSTAARALGK